MAPTVTIRRSSRARHARLQITRQGQAVVVLPLRAPDHVADELLTLRAGWLQLHQGRILAARARLADRPPLGERPLPLGGIPHAIEVAPLPGGGGRTRIEHHDTGKPTIRLLLASGDERPLGEILEPWLRREARHTIGRRVALRAPQVGVTPARVAIRDQRSRWGSASRRGSLSFSWRLVLAPPAVLDYVVVHELAHLLDFSHSPAFWAPVRAIVEDVEAARRWLRGNELELRHALD